MKLLLTTESIAKLIIEKSPKALCAMELECWVLEEKRNLGTTGKRPKVSFKQITDYIHKNSNIRILRGC